MSASILNFWLLMGGAFLCVSFAHFCARQGKEALIAWIALQGILANLFVLKEIPLLGMNATASDVFAISAIVGLTLCVERFGQEAAKLAIKTGLILAVFFCVMSQWHLLYQPSALDTTQSAYLKLFEHTPRLIISSLAVFYIVESISVRLYPWIKQKFLHLPQWGHLMLTLLICQCLDTILFSGLGLYGIVHSLWQIILVSYAIKVVVVLTVSLLYERTIFQI